METATRARVATVTAAGARAVVKRDESASIKYLNITTRIVYMDNS